jgi:hypothetical protein
MKQKKCPAERSCWKLLNLLYSLKLIRYDAHLSGDEVYYLDRLMVNSLIKGYNDRRRFCKTKY